MEKMEKIRENSTYPHPEWISERVVSLLLSSLILLSSAIIVLLISVLISFGNPSIPLNEIFVLSHNTVLLSVFMKYSIKKKLWKHLTVGEGLGKQF